MKLRNKKTGEIVPASNIAVGIGNDGKWYDSLAELNEEWEDYKEPKSGIEGIRLNDMIAGRHIVEIDFTEVKQAEKVVEKLKAFKRLKDKGISFKGKVIDKKWYIEVKSDPEQRCFDEACDVWDDIMLIFGGEE